MVQLIVGDKGKGKTKYLLDKVNSEVQKVEGNIVFLDKSAKKMYELNNKVRLINVPDYLISSSDEFIGFICGIISQDHDLQQMYLDSVLQVACIEDKDISRIIHKLNIISEKFHIDFVLSVSMDEKELPEEYKSMVIVSL
ncbi:MAG: twitching motility protein PilT [Lachnospiraceae bacterium]|nr:twitching motility protein PilT [Lachnospiraceae bacterium]